jgi:hypothetical protein
MNSRLLDSPMDSPPAQPAIRYRAVSRAAVGSLVLAALSALVVFGWFFGAIPAAAIVLGWIALRQIERTPEEYTGVGLAWGGIGLAAVLWIAGYGWLWFAVASEVPVGYQRVEYVELQPNPRVKGELVPEAAVKLDGKKVYVKGYMVPGRQQARLRKFLLCPTNGVCTFHFPNPKPTEVIAITLTSDLSTDYTAQLIGLGGKFHVDLLSPSGVPYSMEADYLR